LNSISEVHWKKDTWNFHLLFVRFGLAKRVTRFQSRRRLECWHV